MQNEPSSSFVFIQQQNLQKLQCSVCHKILSIFPIYRDTASESYVICGRCPRDETLTLFRDQLYESIAEFHKFPCINKNYGCLESLVPSKMIIHEKKNCLYKIYECFAKNIDNNECNWRGQLGCLLEHFVMNHPTLILNDCRFEVDFINTHHNEKYLLLYAENLFSITKSWNSTTQIYSILLEYIIGSNPVSINQYSYEVILENANKSSSYTIEEVIDKKIDFQLYNVNAKLQNPITIIATVNIKKKRLNNSEAADQNYDLLSLSDATNNDEETLKEVECPVCMMYFVPPVFQCLIGHSICKNCVSTLEDCPTCHSTFSKFHNFALEAIIWNMIYPCKNSPRCRFRSKVKNLEKHEETCIYGSYKCPLKLSENCNEEFPFFELYNHIQFRHYENLLKFDNITLPFDETFEEDILEEYILVYDDLLFKLCFMYQNVEKRFLWSIQLFHSSVDCTKYDFELEIIDTIGNNRRIHLKSKCAPYTVQVTAQELEEKGVYLDFAQIREFINNQLTYRVIISKSSHSLTLID